MKIEIIADKSSEGYKTANALYEQAFAEIERRDETGQGRALQSAAYRYGKITNDDGEPDGIMLYWETADFIYLEHFAVQPEKRNRGIASAALTLLKEQKRKPIILEIEPPEDEITRRRYGFYLRNDFVMNPHRHFQIKYHEGDGDLELKILSYPREFTAKEYSGFRDFLEREVAACSH